MRWMPEGHAWLLPVALSVRYRGFWNSSVFCLNPEVCPWREKMLIACAGRRKSELSVINSIQTDRPMSGFTYDELPDIRKSLSQLDAEIGMGNEDKSFSLLSQRPSIQIHCAEPSHHPVHVSPGRYPRLWVFELPHINPLREH